MKKLMLGFGMAAAMVAVADIESSNIVGYGTKTLNANFGKKNYITAQFCPIGTDGSAMTVASLVPTADFEFDNDKIWIFNADGNIEIQLYYASQQDLVDNEILTDFPNATPGWYSVSQVDEDWDFSTNMNNFSLPQGAMILVTTKNDGAGITTSGEVNGEDIPLSLNTAFGKKNYIGNCSPVDLTLGEIVADGGFEFDNDKIWIFDEDGNISYQFYYASQQDLLDNEILIDFPGAVPGWYTVSQVDEDWDFSTNMNNFAIPAGMGFMVTSKNDGAEIIIPAAY